MLFRSMQKKLEVLVKSNPDEGLMIIARTDAYAVEGLDAAIQRAMAYQHTGADVIFAESLSSIDEYRQFTDALDIPILANMTEFGRTPLLGLQDLASVNIALVLYPLSAFRAMSQAALETYKIIKNTEIGRAHV